MNRTKGQTSIVASPVLIGAITVLVTLVAVFLAYNANKGLPFVPTYDLSIKLPTGANLVPGNDVRIGGFRVGVISDLRPGVDNTGGQHKSIAIVSVHLDKSIQPLSNDTRVVVRSRSALGLKYIQLTPGTGIRTFQPGDTIPLRNAAKTVEFDDLLNTFDEPTRISSQAGLVGFGDALAGRGTSINTAIEAFNPFFQYLQPVMANLSNPSTQLDQFFRQIGNVTAQLAPVAHINAVVFTNMANTFSAFNRCPGCLQATIQENPVTQAAAIASFKVQNPFLDDFASLSRQLIPAAQELPVALPPLNSALAVGTPVLRSSVTLNNETKNVFASLDQLFRDPNTLLALQDLRDTLGVLKPLINYVAPFQTVCNYANYFTSGLGEHMSEGTTGGASERILLKLDNSTQTNRLSDFGFRPVDVPANMNTHTAKDPLTGQALEAIHAPAYPPAIDSQGNANCQVGQYGYPQGPIGGIVPSRYPPASVSLTGNPTTDENTITNFEKYQSGGSHIVAGTYPALAGPTFTGVKNLKDVP